MAKQPQTMKPATAAKKLGIYLPAAPADFQEHPITREALQELMNDPPEWLQELRANGPHPRPVVAHKLNVTISGLTRGGVTEPLTTQEIDALLAEGKLRGKCFLATKLAADSRVELEEQWAASSKRRQCG